MFKFPQSQPVNALAIGEFSPAHVTKGLGLVSEAVEYWFPQDLTNPACRSGQGLRVPLFSNAASK